MKFIILATLIAGVFSQGCHPEDTHYYPDSQQCDRYIACRLGVETEELCPNGLLFNEQLTNGAYPCAFPNEVDCGQRTKTQQPQPTQNCPNQWAYAGTGDRSQCETFWTCVDGREFKSTCPEGLAFSTQSYRCEYPDESPDCDSHAYLGFSCPAEPDIHQVRTVGVPRYASPRDCRKFFLCAGTSPRVHTCELGRVFNENTYGCDEPENVQGCGSYYPPEELKEIRDQRERRRIVESEREARYQERLAQLNQRKQG